VCLCIVVVLHFVGANCALFLVLGPPGSSARSDIYVCQLSDDSDGADTSVLQCLTGHDDEVNAVCWSPGGELLASCSDDSTAKIWTVEKGLKFDLKGHAKEIFTLRWTPTGANSAHPDKPLLLCTASFDGTVKVRGGFVFVWRNIGYALLLCVSVCVVFVSVTVVAR
jgi:WD40 repeat protein